MPTGGLCLHGHWWAFELQDHIFKNGNDLNENYVQKLIPQFFNKTLLYIFFCA